MSITIELLVLHNLELLSMNVFFFRVIEKISTLKFEKFDLTFRSLKRVVGDDRSFSIALTGKLTTRVSSSQKWNRK